LVHEDEYNHENIALLHIAAAIFVVRLHVMQRTVLQSFSIRLSVRLSKACIVTKRKKLVPQFYTA